MKIRLTVLQGGTQGARIKIKSSPFVLGRGDDCQLKLNSRSVSRKHCVITCEGDRVTIQDLGSRNGTVVGSRTLQAGQACRLFHHNEIQVGKIRFRMSVRDPVSNQPLWPGDGPEDLLEQLDSLVDRDEWIEDPTSHKEDATTGMTGGMSPHPAAGDEASSATTASISSAASDHHSDAAESQGDPAEQTAGPRRLPEHLRPKRAADSQDAANEALRRMFTR